MGMLASVGIILKILREAKVFPKNNSPIQTYTSQIGENATASKRKIIALPFDTWNDREYP